MGCSVGTRRRGRLGCLRLGRLLGRRLGRRLGRLLGRRLGRGLGRWRGGGQGEQSGLRARRAVAPPGSSLGGRHAGGVADELAQQVADGVRAVDLLGPGGVEVDDLVAQGVQRARDAGADLARPEHAPALQGCGRYGGARDAGPPSGEQEVEEPGQVGDVGRDAAGREAHQGRVDREPDHADRAADVDQHVLRHQASVRDPGVVGDRDRPGDLGHDPGGPARAHRSLVRDQDVEGGAGAPLVDDVADVTLLIDVQDPQDPPVEHRRRPPGGGHHPLGPLVAGRDHVHGDVAVERAVVCAPEPPVAALAEQVDQEVAAGQDIPRTDRVRHWVPASSRRGSLDV